MSNIDEEKVMQYAAVIGGLLICGYLIGRFTAIHDLRMGYLNALIPK